MVTISDIAKQCGVSKATVSKALNGHTDISPDTAETIRKTARELGYLPNATAKILKLGRTHNVGVLFVDEVGGGLSHEYFSKIFESLKRESEKEGYDITFISKDIGMFKMDYYEHAKYRQCDGVIIAAADFEDPAVIRLVNSEIPTVTLDYAFNNHTAIMSDNVSGINEIVKYAHGRGHRKIAFIHGDMTAVTQIRLASFYRTCKELGIDVPENYVYQAKFHDPDSSALATKKILKLKDRPTCILYPDDFSLIGGMNVLEQEGLSVPDDMSVAGYDGILLSQILRPKLTTYQQDALAIGKEASKRLVDIVENPKLAIAEVVQIPGKLLEGGTIRDLRAK